MAKSFIRDRLPYEKVQERFREDFYLPISVGFISDCIKDAHSQFNELDRIEWMKQVFSGVLCIDELHDSGRVFLYATDPLNDFTVDFAVNDKNDQQSMNIFLQQIKDKGITPEVVITDGSPLYKDDLVKIWKGVSHQLCVFHVIKDVNKCILKELRRIKNNISKKGNKGRKKKRGKPSKSTQYQRNKRDYMTLKEQAAFIWEHQYLIVRKSETLTKEDKKNLAILYEISSDIKILREFSQEFYALLSKEISPRQARYRWTRLMGRKKYKGFTHLENALKKLSKDKFEKMIVHLYYENVDRTSNHVERHNRSFRMLQKTRYKHRRLKNIIMIIELHLLRQMKKHQEEYDYEKLIQMVA